jgi:hypothetical protein
MYIACHRACSPSSVPNTAHWSETDNYARPPVVAPVRPRQRLRLVVVQETPGIWLVRGLEHDVFAEGRSIGAAVRAAIGFVEAHTAFDCRHDLRPLSAFPPAPSGYWHAYAAGTAVSLTQLGIEPPAGWDICAAVADRRV